ncbi:glycosyltransferase involved in cell wall biosynthesis [Curtobacterium sp. 320]|uniref:glycosyltransferase family 4 protein n=1 Tax=unclassified Curtobacterium TaxID=257496 RepID=UPI0008DE4F39|nr:MULTISPECIES: glycosyltransferase family 1 protein [unclassified Curtobacterium]MCC8909383.1 glycosyltransferase family 4 protein [Curtobacterium sp. GD1]MCT9622573.1 glycosyltransferase family 4 protein [Curtobacterium sp. C2H10]MDR6571963.1 glycosyltransferase involved in cell wall biosynthesis [Curtobacterium sp. 320]OII16086.1 mannosyltransferase [Curtobacterium sp. MCBA15_013]SFF66882.1 Glycosyltransferase involved in cell wall bisynthesis [Curtobacterium sp. YR515]
MTTLHVVVDQIVAPVPGGIGRYAEELTRHLIAGAPEGADVAGIVSAVGKDELAHIRTLLPGLGDLDRLALPRRELSLAWQGGFVGGVGRGMVHSPSVLAPLVKHDRFSDPGRQTVVTVHDTVPWTHPETLTPRGVHFHRAMVKRAWKHADAVVVPTHAVAATLNGIHRFDERLRVIGGAPSGRLRTPVDADLRAERLGLPERYVLAVGTLEPRKGLQYLIEAMAHPDAPADVPLVIAGPDGWGDVDVYGTAERAGLSRDRVKVLGRIDDQDLAVAYDRATVFVFPSLAEGFGLPVIEAMSFGTPVVHSDDDAVREVASDAGVTVARDPRDSYPERLAQAVYQVVNDPLLAGQLAVAGPDRARMYDWKDSAAETWQLHADL